MTLELAEKSYKYGFAITYDGDNQKILYGTHCNHCDDYFESEEMDVYCNKC